MRRPKLGIRGRTGSARINVAGLRSLLGLDDEGGGRIELGTIQLFDGESAHWTTTDEGDVIVSVRMDQGHVELWALWSPLVGGANKGIYLIPAVGTEVVVGFPLGDYEGDPVVLGCLPTAGVPDDLDATKVLIVGVEVWVYDGTGTPMPLATLADVQAIQSDLDGHSHTYIPGTGSPATTTLNPSVTAPSGTSVLKAK